MTEPTHERRSDTDALLDDILARIMARVGMDDIPEARARLRRELMYAWDDGESAGWRAAVNPEDPRRNPWKKSDNA